MIKGLKAVGWKILIKPYTPPDKVGSIILTDQTKDRSMIGAVVAQVLDIGPLCWTGAEFNGPWCKVGDWVIIGKLAGARLDYDNEEYRLINEDEIQGITDYPEKCKRV